MLNITQEAGVPHIVVEYSANIHDRMQLPALLEKLHAAPPGAATTASPTVTPTTRSCTCR
jgi:hypothetical protein